MSWIRDLVKPEARLWEEFYRNRWQHDRVVRSTHGVNCTGGCSWKVYVKDGIITWEMQETDYPLLESGLPGYEPRGCQRGISFSWYIYSPLRIKYPYLRGTLAELWRAAKDAHSDPVAAWGSIVEDEEKRRSYQQARGKGGFRRIPWEEALEIVAASSLYTAKRYGPDRVVGFSPIPAMSMCSYASGTRFLQLFGGVVLSFYDWYADFPPASPEVWGEKTDVAESADWYNSKLIAIVGTNLSMTRTPDVHFAAEARNNGSRLVVLSPDFSQVSKYADWWLPVNAGMDGAFWMAVDHVLLKEFYADRQVPYFLDYLKRYSDAPFLVALEESAEGCRPGRFLRADALPRYRNAENAGWKFLVFDETAGAPKMPLGSIGFRWQEEKGKWNLEMKDGLDGAEIRPLLTLPREPGGGASGHLHGTRGRENLPARRAGPVRRNGAGERSGDDGLRPPDGAIRRRARAGRGIPGRLQRRGGAVHARLAGAVHRRGTRDDHPVRQGMGVDGGKDRGKMHDPHRLRCEPLVSRQPELPGRDHGPGPVRLRGGERRRAQPLHRPGEGHSRSLLVDPRVREGLGKAVEAPERPSFHYVHSDQWRYDLGVSGSSPGEAPGMPGRKHPVEYLADSVRMGWLPFAPQFNRNPAELVREAEAAGAKSDAEIVGWVVEQLRSGRSPLRGGGPGRPGKLAPRVADLAGKRAPGQRQGARIFSQALPRHPSQLPSRTRPRPARSGDVSRREPAPRGKLDLVVDVNFRMDTSALYSDMILPAATWYEKDDLNTTDLHSFIHPLSRRGPSVLGIPAPTGTSSRRSP